MNAKPALVRPRFASDLEPHVALWATRLSISFYGACRTLNNGMNSEELRQIIGITPVEGLIPPATLPPLLRVRAEELEQQQPRRLNTLQRNTAMLGKLLDLSPLQIDIVTFFFGSFATASCISRMSEALSFGFSCAFFLAASCIACICCLSRATVLTS